MNKSINNFIEYWQAIKSITYASDEMLLFRGHSDHKYRLEPNVFRNKDKNCEQKIYREIMLQYPEDFKERSHLSNLVKMQHYGGATRLLDFSRNPLVALFFASESGRNQDGQVVVCKVKKDKILHHNSDRALMLSCLPCLTDKDRAEIKEICEYIAGRITQGKIEKYGAINKLLHEIRGEYPAFECEIVTDDLLNTFFVSPFKDNQRMKLQDGMFALFGLRDRKLEDICDLEIHRINIVSKAKKEILHDLDLMGISNAKLYSGLERRAMELSRRRADWIDIDSLGSK